MTEALIQLPAGVALELAQNILWLFRGGPQHQVNVRLPHMQGIERPPFVPANLLDCF